MSKRRVYWLALLAVLALAALACSTGGEATESAEDAPDLEGTQAALEATQSALEAAQEQADADAEATAQAENEAEAEAEVESEVTEESAEAAGEEPPDYFVEEWEAIEHLDWWDEFLISGDIDQSELYLSDGRLIFELDGEDIYDYLIYAEWYYSDIRIDLEVRNVGSNNNNVSLICRENERGWYEFNIANNGLYSILMYEYDTGEYSLLYNGGAEEIRTGKNTNVYTAICQGDTLTLGVNGVEVRSITNTTFIEGYAGISVSSFESLPVVVEFNWVEFSAP